ncbi:hypothetical protein [Jejuia pallidilutea]|uniref:hypothetical protein n=1 Tax=Jejuia pallidilutea TaxID=504487 RepID=UPI00126A5F0A|nr:hypothetical protein [Jejuia pallidilutea]
MASLLVLGTANAENVEDTPNEDVLKKEQGVNVPKACWVKKVSIKFENNKPKLSIKWVNGTEKPCVSTGGTCKSKPCEE